ncbi:MAG: glycosyltransferase family 4 protein [Phycisphaerae bacterium]|nr:glycosyltransferase family 4 protein [Phycisphaerae bacterium]
MTSPGATRPHILFINEFYYPDVCASSAVLSDHLPKIAARRPDWRISVLAGDSAWDRPDIRWPSRETHERVEIHRVRRSAVKRSLSGRAWGFARFHLTAIAAGRRLERPDVIVASTAPPLGARIGLRIARSHGAHLIYKVLDLYPDCAAALRVVRRGGLLHRAWRWIDSGAMRRAAAVVCISQAMTQRVTTTRPIPSSRVHCLPDGFDAARIDRRGPNRFRREHGLEGAFVVQYAGNMGLSHPFETILAAARLLKDENVRFQFIGAGPGRETIRAALADGAIRGQLLDYQPAERLAEVLDTADVGLISQHDDMADLALPYKVYGLLAAGKPSIFVGSDRSEIVAWFREHECGFHVAHGQAEHLASTLRQLVADRPLREAMGRRARRLFDERFTSERVVAGWIRLIEQVLYGPGDRT